MDAGEEEDPPVKKAKLVRFAAYFGLTLVVNGTICVVTILLWSSMLGHGEASFDFLGTYAAWSYLLGGIAAAILLVLYMLDFFWPPHMPGSHCRLWQGDRFLGRSVLAVAVTLLALATMLWGKTYPSIPVLVTILICPCAAAAVRMVYAWLVLAPQNAGDELLMSRKSDIIEHGNIHVKMLLLKRITGEENDALMFFKACAATFMACFLTSLIVWLIWVLVASKGLKSLDAATDDDHRDRLYIQWATPLVVAIANFVYGLFALLRVFMQRAYSRTDKYKNRLIADCMRSSLMREATQHRVELLKAARASKVLKFEEGDELEEKRKQYMEQHAGQAMQLSMIVKVVGCTFIVLIGLLYVAGQLLYADTHIASLVMGAMGTFFICFCAFVYASFGRVVNAMGQWLVDLPAWQTCHHLLESDWSHGLHFVAFFPLVPVIALLSMVNQFVRKKRGLYELIPDPNKEPPASSGAAEAREARGSQASGSGDAAGQSEAAAADGGDEAEEKAVVAVKHFFADLNRLPPGVQCEEILLTPRVYNRWAVVLNWNISSVATKAYIICAVYVVYTLCPTLLNVVLAWMTKALADFDFGLIVAATFVIGVVAFLLPPVPGMTVYLFGGLVISGSCPPKGTEKGFWYGAIINVGVCWLLKLVACAVQQVCIGGMLGKSLWVKQTVGIHKVSIRCIESILRQPGLSVGKVAILCGGPDWPTSVLAGVLNLSLVQCELGTVPIILFVLPCALSGSLYLRKDESDMWDKSADLMIVSSVMVNLLLWALVAWSMQSELEHRYEELTRRLPEHVDLEWLDYRAKKIAERSAVQWKEIPRPVQVLFIAGAIIHILVMQLMLFSYNSFIGEFKVSDDIEDLKFFGQTTDDALFTYACVAVLGVYFGAWLLYAQFVVWRGRKTRGPRQEAAKELDLTEASWKEAWLREAEEEARRLEPTGGEVPSPEDGPLEEAGKVSSV